MTAYGAFLIKLVVLTVILIAVSAAGVYFSPFFAAFQDFTWVSLVFFFVVTALIFYLGLKAIHTKSSYSFVSIINGSVLGKILLCSFFVIGYAILEKPSDVSFIIPFFLFYIIYTAFEIRQLLLAEKKSRDLKKND